jgi:hypothetical protein
MLDFYAKNGIIAGTAIFGLFFRKVQLMMLKLRRFLVGAAVCALIYTNACALHAGTILKLDLGNVGPDLSMNASGVLGTADDANAGTTGNQNTGIEFTGFLEPIPDINTSVASFTLSNLAAAGPATVFSPVVVQNFVGGTFSLYDQSNSLLLSGSLSSSSLQGTLGPPGTGAVFTTNVALVTGGFLAPFILPNTLDLSMQLTNVNGGTGFSVDGILNQFSADSFVSISGDPTPLGENFPEPGTLVLGSIALFAAAALRRRSR